jgi:sulfite exporter TauE/SafE
MLDLADLAALCRPPGAGAALTAGYYAAMALGGLAGSALHCGPMCGGFVLAQVGRRLGAVPAARMCEASRLSAGLLPGYHAGRIATYAGLGALAGGLGSGLAALAPVRLAAAGLLALAAAAFLATAVGLGSGRLTARPIAAAVRRLGPAGGLPTGLVLGFLPCGLVYAALAGAAAAASPVAGALGLAAFGLGTVPMLAAVGVLGERIGRRHAGLVRTAAPWIMGVDAALLLLLAVRLA